MYDFKHNYVHIFDDHSPIRDGGDVVPIFCTFTVRMW